MGKPQFIRDGSGRFAAKSLTKSQAPQAPASRRFGRLHSAIKTQRLLDGALSVFSTSNPRVPAYDDIYDLYHNYNN